MPNNFYYLDESGLSHLWDLIKQLQQQGGIVLDPTPTNGSTNGVTSGGVYTALSSKANLASPAFTGTPTAPDLPSNWAGTSTQIVNANSLHDILGGNKQIVTGNTTQYSVAAGGSKDITISLPFSVFVSAAVCGLTSNQKQLIGYCSAAITSIGVSSTTITLVNNSTSARNLGAYYIIMGQ